MNWLLNRIKSYGETAAIISDDQVCTYAELAILIEKWLDHPALVAAPQGSIFSLESSYSPNATGLLIALAMHKHIVVPIGRVSAEKKAEFLDVADIEYRLVPSTNGQFDCLPTDRKADHEFYTRLRTGGSAGLVLFSSGTTGRSKATVLDFSKVIAKHEVEKKAKTTLGFLTLDHIGGINTLMHTVAHGGKLVSITDRSPEHVCKTLAEHRIEILPTTPTFLNMCLISGALQRYDLSALKLVTYGTEPMPANTLVKMAEALPNVRLKQTYGLSEVGILPTVSRSNNELWVKIGGEGFDYKIVDRILWIKSDTAMLGYLNASAPFDDEGYFNTQDLVDVDGEWLRILGRKSEIINVGGEKVYPSEVENVILQMGDILDVTVSGKANPITGMVVKATVRPANDENIDDLPQRIQAHCAAVLEPYKVPALIVVSNDEQHSDRFKKTRSV